MSELKKKLQPSKSAQNDAPYPTSPVVAASLIGGYSIGRLTGIRALAGVGLAVGGVLAGREWLKQGPAKTVALSVSFLGAFGLAHPLAKRVGTWPAVFIAAGLAAGITALVADRNATWK